MPWMTSLILMRFFHCVPSSAQKVEVGTICGVFRRVEIVSRPETFDKGYLGVLD